MIYIESTLEDGTYINNIEFKENKVVIETSEGEELEFLLDEEIEVRVFDVVEIKTVEDFINAAKDNRVYCNQDLEKEALMQVFPDINLKGLIVDDSLELEELANISNYAFGKLKGKRKDITFAEMKKIIDKAVISEKEELDLSSYK
ncbi:MAG: hypothetical protein CL760_09070 [Chloroflexi bacterium]|nr:hypothetical protein [Chloroflexota bacterium]|tara:strand:- start:36880 stop:37317 length:438 start_codon:yes stop_codon:yes gene_type:complete